MLSAHSKAPSQLNIPSANNVVLVSLGTNLEVILNGTLKATNSTWQLLQFHFHTPFEHHVDLAHHEAERYTIFTASDADEMRSNCAVLATSVLFARCLVLP
ncbi:hypothetical protein FIBSPDRAFT_1053870 [Athelia psychrophila]|uniref:Alpha-carbonic anhydrase domain-containing protein n=1 Tax=Athelia psychrophila TaxID=1759441 RepID=A0A167W9T4_9AGAM|nr:hypothetical protein FIBSPDRAFT_1053870 [Fibularhizoctonia sp. CBS 109695]